MCALLPRFGGAIWCYGAAYVTSKFLRIISAKRKNIVRYVKFSRMFLQNVKCLRYGTLRYDTWGLKTRIRLLQLKNKARAIFFSWSCSGSSILEQLHVRVFGTALLTVGPSWLKPSFNVRNEGNGRTKNVKILSKNKFQTKTIPGIASMKRRQRLLCNLAYAKSASTW